MTNTSQKNKWLLSLLCLIGFIALLFQQAVAGNVPGVRLDDIVIEVGGEKSGSALDIGQIGLDQKSLKTILKKMAFVELTEKNILSHVKGRPRSSC
ncbi:MAG: hypothetical protein GY774_20365 [Planctomycetes bacterium]|nr:hypothetical protein [Planctomycetota bacterium]